MTKVIIIFVIIMIISLNHAIFNYASVIASFPKSRFILVVNGAKNLRVALIAIAKWFKGIIPIYLIRMTLVIIIRRMIIES